MAMRGSPALDLSVMFSSLALVVLLVSVIELFVLVSVAKAIGSVLAIALLLAVSAVGFVVVRAQGGGAIRTAGDALRQGASPSSREVADRGLRLLGGLLILIPGFVTGLVGLALLIRPIRALVRPLVETRASVWLAPTIRFRRNIVDVDEADAESTDDAWPRLS